MERRFETTTLKNPAEEKKVMLELKALKASKVPAEKLLELKPEIDALYAQKKEISNTLNGLQDDIDARNTEIEKIKKEMEEAREKRADIKEQLDKFEADI